MYRMNKYILFVFLATLFIFACGVVEKLANRPPVITRVYVLRTMLSTNDTTTVGVEAEDPDNNILSYNWSAVAGSFSSSQGQRVVWTAPNRAGQFNLKVTVRDENQAEVEDEVAITVLSQERPAVEIVEPKNNAYIPGRGTITIKAYASHPNKIGKVVFYVNNEYIGIDNRILDGGLYKVDWVLDNLSGKMTLKAIAYRFNSETIKGEHSITVYVQGVSVVPQ